MKLGLLIDRNPKLYCWIEGHTDLVGGDEFNLDLSRRRAASVREYLVKSLRMDGDKIPTRGKGWHEPLVNAGTVDEQAPNRRVEIRMRKTPPPPEPAYPVPRALPAAPEALVSPPPAARVAEPQRALPVAKPPLEPPPPRAEPVAESATPPVPRAEPVVPPRAQPVEPPRAQPVETPRAEPVVPPRAEPVEE